MLISKFEGVHTEKLRNIAPLSQSKVLIDFDPGTDDALALMMALNSPQLSVEGITTVGGNATLVHTTRNALKLAEYLGVHEISIAQGSTRPLRGNFHYGYDFHGTDGLGVQFPDSKNSLRPVKAPSYITNLVASCPGEVTLIALGPLTNIAKALIIEPKLVDWLREIVIMGGALEIPGNVTPHAEFNIFNDPEAAKIVLSSGAHITLVGLDVCEQITVMRNDLPWLAGTSKTAHLTNVILNNWFSSHLDRESYSLCDPLAVAAAISPTLLTCQQCSVAVESKEGEYKGKTVAVRGEGQVRVAFGVDVELSKMLMMSLLNSGSD